MASTHCRGEARVDRARREVGQSSVEYALVLLAFLSTVVALGALWHFAQEGEMQKRAKRCAAHSLEEGITVAFLQDLSAF